LHCIAWMPKLWPLMKESILTPEEQAAFAQQVEACNANIAKHEAEIRAAQAKLKAEITMRDSLAAQMGAPALMVVGTTQAGFAGLSETIRVVIKEANKPVKPPFVAGELKRRQFPYTATTPLVTRVGNEMRRMTRAGMLVKRGSKYELARMNGLEGDQIAN
jgi:hypothetical protein